MNVIGQALQLFVVDEVTRKWSIIETNQRKIPPRALSILDAAGNIETEMLLNSSIPRTANISTITLVLFITNDIIATK